MALSLIRIKVESVVKASSQRLAFTHIALFINKIIRKVKGESRKEIYYELYHKCWAGWLLSSIWSQFRPTISLSHSYYNVFINSLCGVIKVRFIHALTACNPCMDCRRSDYSLYPELPYSVIQFRKGCFVFLFRQIWNPHLHKEPPPNT